jgi:hypothetical protein
MSLEPRMTASFARVRARGPQLGLTRPVRWENGGSCATKFHRILSCAGRGTGLDGGDGKFSPVGPGKRETGFVALSSLAVSIYVRIQGVSARHRTGFRTASKMRLYWGQAVPFRPILFHPFLLIWNMRNMPHQPNRSTGLCTGTKAEIFNLYAIIWYHFAPGERS